MTSNPVDTEQVLAEFFAEYDENMDQLAESGALKKSQAKLAKNLGKDVIKFLQDRMREKGMRMVIIRIEDPTE